MDFFNGVCVLIATGMWSEWTDKANIASTVPFPSAKFI
jgi:hypothetical protein